jgi:hypothetical protein
MRDISGSYLEDFLAMIGTALLETFAASMLLKQRRTA